MLAYRQVKNNWINIIAVRLGWQLWPWLVRLVGQTAPLVVIQVAVGWAYRNVRNLLNLLNLLNDPSSPLRYSLLFRSYAFRLSNGPYSCRRCFFPSNPCPFCFCFWGVAARCL